MSNSIDALPERESILDFMHIARSALSEAENGKHITIVAGNESADLDSLSCALLYAYIRTFTPSPHRFSRAYAPLLAIPRSDLALRPEFRALLSHVDLSPDDLITVDEISPSLHPDNTRWVLVDHNALGGKFEGKYSKRVVGCIDHHEDESKVPGDAEEQFGEPRVVKKAGSCSSLVVQCLRDAWSELSKNAEEEEKQWDRQVATLAMGSILVDTRNLVDENKTTDDDREAVEYLEEKINDGGGVFDRKKFFEDIDAAKKNLESLTVEDVLRKDYKEWREGQVDIGVSSMVKSIEWIKEKAESEEQDMKGHDALLSRMKKFAEERDLEVYALMTAYTDDEGRFRRELMVWAFEKHAIDAAKRFQAMSADELGLEDWNIDRGFDEENGQEWRKVWWQHKVQHSRKRVAPLLRKAMREENGISS